MNGNKPSELQKKFPTPSEEHVQGKQVGGEGKQDTLVGHEETEVCCYLSLLFFKPS